MNESRQTLKISLVVFAIQDIALFLLIVFTWIIQIEIFYLALFLLPFVFGLMLRYGKIKDLILLSLINIFLLGVLFLLAFSLWEIVISHFQSISRSSGFSAYFSEILSKIFLMMCLPTVVFPLNVIGITIADNFNKKYVNYQSNEQDMLNKSSNELAPDITSKLLSRTALSLIILFSLFIVVIVFGMFLIGIIKNREAENRSAEQEVLANSADGITIQRMLSMNSSIRDYYQDQDHLPDSMKDTKYEEKFRMENNPIIYKKVDSYSYNICANFEKNYDDSVFDAAHLRVFNSINKDDWHYSAGNFCFHGNMQDDFRPKPTDH